MGTGSFPGVKRPGRVVNHPPQSSAEVKETVELYLCSPSGLSWPILGWTLPFIIIIIIIISSSSIYAQQADRERRFKIFSEERKVVANWNFPTGSVWSSILTTSAVKNTADASLSEYGEILALRTCNWNPEVMCSNMSWNMQVLWCYCLCRI